MWQDTLDLPTNHMLHIVPIKSNSHYCLQFPGNRRFLLDSTYQVPTRCIYNCTSCIRGIRGYLGCSAFNLHESTYNRREWKQIEHCFSTRWNFPNCVGSLDGKLVMIKALPNSYSLFYNYKGFFSIVLMALVDADYRFIYVDVGDFGSNGDSGIFQNCPLGKNFMEGNLDLSLKHLPGWAVGGALPHCFVGDEAFPLHMDLMRPFPRGKKEKQLPYNKMIFNYRLSIWRTCSTVESL